MYRISSKLKSLKNPLKNTNKEFYRNITVRVQAATEELHIIQRYLMENPSDIMARRNEKEMVLRYADSSRSEESFYR